MRWLRPNRWGKFLHTTYGEWTLPNTTKQELLQALKDMSEFQLESAKMNAPFFQVLDEDFLQKGTKIRINFLTPGVSFCDACTLLVVEESPDLKVKFTNKSCATIPVNLPVFVNIPLSLLTFWVPLHDKDNYTTTTMEVFQENVDKKTGRESTMVRKRYL
jgi:hypothetical protein